MNLESKNRIKSLINSVNNKTNLIYLDLKSIATHLCDCYNGDIGNDELQEYDLEEDFETVNTLKSILNKVNNKTGFFHLDVTSALQTLCNGLSEKTPLYSFAVVSDIHIQYATGYTDFQRALSYFKNKNIPFTCVCGDLTWAATMINASYYTTEWKGGLQDYKDIIGDNIVYAIGGNHECYTATYDISAKSWSSVDTGFDIDLWKENTGCDAFYTISSEPDDTTTHNVHNANIPDTDVFIMISIKHATNPNLFFTSDDGEDEFEWLQTTLENNKNKRCYVFFHEHDNQDKTADPYLLYPHGISEGTVQGKAFIDLMRNYKNVIWFHGHTHNTFNEEYYSIANITERGYKSVNVPSLQGPRKFNESTGGFVSAGEDSECYIIDVFDNYIVLNALDLTSVSQDGYGDATLIEKYILDTTY